MLKANVIFAVQTNFGKKKTLKKVGRTACNPLCTFRSVSFLDCLARLHTALCSPVKLCNKRSTYMYFLLEKNLL